MRWFFMLFICLAAFCLKAQEGFIQAYDINEKGMTFHNMLLVEDTLMVFGEARINETSPWGVYFAKMDTFGNILDYKIHFDSLGDSYSFEQGYEVIKTSDGGYALVGQLFYRQYPVLIKLDVKGELDFVKEYPDETVFDIRHWNIVEIEQGYISLGVKQQMGDGKWDIFIMRTDKNGEKIWEVSYGEHNVYDHLRGLKKINENEFLITGGISNGGQSVTNYEVWEKAKAIKIDTLGNIFWEYEGELHYADGFQSNPRHLFRDTDGNWVHEGGFVRVLNDTESVFQGEIVKRDTNFNIIWSTRFGEPTSNKNNFVDLAQTPDGGWVAAGQYANLLPGTEAAGYLAGWMAKVNADGDSLWSRTDTVFWHPSSGSTNYLSGVVVLPSGSIIACGHLNRYAPEPAKSFGWIIKIDKHGCINPGCNPVLDGLNLTPLIEHFDIFPNPIADRVHISGKGLFNIMLYDGKGRILLSKKNVFEKTSLILNDFPKGIYFIKMKKGNRILTKKIVKQ